MVIVIQSTSTLDECLCKCFVDSPVALLVCIAQCGEPDRTREAQVIQLLRMGIQTQHDTAGTFAKCELSEAETEELLPARKGFYRVITMICIDALLERVTGEDTRELVENVVAGVHAERGEMWSDLPLPN